MVGVTAVRATWASLDVGTLTAANRQWRFER
jgi:hypothetical protein